MTTKRILAMIIATIMLVSVLAGCETKHIKVKTEINKGITEEQSEQKEEKWGAFIIISEVSRYGNFPTKQTHVYDPETGVEYVVIQGLESADCVPLYNADGTLKLYNPNAEAN